MLRGSCLCGAVSYSAAGPVDIELYTGTKPSWLPQA